MIGPFVRTSLLFCAGALGLAHAGACAAQDAATAQPARPADVAPANAPLATASGWGAIAPTATTPTPADAPAPAALAMIPARPSVPVADTATSDARPPARDGSAASGSLPPTQAPAPTAGEQAPPQQPPGAPVTTGGATADNGADAGKPADTVSGTVPTAAVPEDRDLWSRIRRGFKMPDLDTKRALASTRWYAAQPDYIARMTGRGSMYLFHIVEEIEKRGMPTELALLPFVESAMQPEAVSFAKAAGLWQFIPSTGRLYSLEQNLWKDERFGVIESTRAALDYLQKLYTEFGDWQLALAAYNCGEAGVERALARARAAHRSLAYKDLRLPKETQYYVPKLQAIKNIIADPQRFGIELPDIRNEPYFVAVSQPRDMDVATAARLADMPIEDFRALNPAFNRPLILGASSPAILVPADRVDTFEANLAALDATGQPLASWTAYTLQSGEGLARLAERVGLTEAQLREANRIPPRYRPAAGSTILVPRDESMSYDIAPGFISASFSLVPESGNLRQVTYRVRRGDSLASVARRWNVQADDIVAWNQLHSMTLFAGQRLSLTVAHPAAASSHKSTKRAAPVVGSNAAVAVHAPAVSAPSRM